MSKKVTLTLGERVEMAKILNAFKGELTQLSTLLDDIKNIAITEEEWKNANLVKTPVMSPEGEPTDKEQWNWTDGEEQLKEMDLSDSTVNYLNSEIQKKSDAKEITLADTALITLQPKLK